MDAPPGMLPLIFAIQKHVAIVSISASAVRGQGSPGIVSAATRFLAVLSLQPFGVGTQDGFQAALEDATDTLQMCLPPPARSWGLARKCMNIFLRDCFYNGQLCTAYDLMASSAFYEIPLDSIVAGSLQRLAGPALLPRWRGVKNLTRENSDAYQAFALSLSRQWNIGRVYLDTDLFIEGRRAAETC